MLLISQSHKQRINELREWGGPKAQRSIDQGLLYLALYDNPETCIVRVSPSEHSPTILIHWDFGADPDTRKMVTMDGALTYNPNLNVWSICTYHPINETR
jgi:hypothetical protein